MFQANILAGISLDCFVIVMRLPLEYNLCVSFECLSILILQTSILQKLQFPDDDRII